MHRRALLHQSRCLRWPLETRTKAVFSFSSSSPLPYPRSAPGSVGDRVRSQHLSSAASSPTPEDEPSSDIEVKPRRRTLRSYAKPPDKSAGANGTLPTALLQNDIHDILWLPLGRPGSQDEPPEDPENDPDTVGLPEQWLLQEAYESLLLTLHPQTQHRATYAANNGQLIEPTLALYCPIEGGDYVVDATVRNIAKRVDADVLVIDAIDLTAGEHGAFGKAAAALQFPQNPLQRSVVPHGTSAQTGRSLSTQDEDDEEDSPPFFMSPSSSFTIQIPVASQTGGPPNYRPSRSGSGAPPLSPLPRSTSPHSSQRVKGFFEDLINLSTETTPSEKEEQIRRPRIVYVRDFPLIANQASVWYPPLLAAVRSRRQGPISRPTSPVNQPTVIVFGMTPPLSEQPTDVPSSSSNVLSMLTGNRPQSVKSSRPESWAEGDWKARERRLKERLRKWQKGHDWLVDELPRFHGNAHNLPTRGSSNSGPEVGFMLGRNVIALPFGSGHDILSSSSSEQTTDGYFRVVGLVPGTRNKLMETNGRFGRRLQYNELAFKMAVAEAGGILTGGCIEEAEDGSPQTLSRMALTWTQAFEPWRDLKLVADAVVGAALAETGVKPSGSSLEPTVVNWAQVERTTAGSAAIQDRKKTWVENAAPSNTIKEDNSAAAGVEGKVPEVDEVLESVRKDPDLDQHEQRLLGCIVDPATMPTTFKSIHLPPATIDSVRTMVSLPLLYPDAFSTGILKTHSMSGALLFGPPGTGKTLLARAIARESGARMMIIKPSDVMDMYVGEGEKLVRSVFTLARRLSPCVVFLDEIDALFGARVSTRESGGAMAHRGVITEFMQEMDGLKSSRDQSVIVIGATNRPFDLDDAVLRRLPRRLLVDLPGPAEREEILKILLRDETLAPDVDLKALARRTETFSGSDLKHLCIAAALDAVKETVDVPWAVPSKTSPLFPLDSASSSEPQASRTAKSVSSSSPGIEPTQQESQQEKSTPHVQRRLASRHFTKALHEITPSASETLGTLLSIRKWNEEFGEGSKGKRRRAWGDKFGFSNIGQGAGLGEARVMTDQPTTSVSLP